MFSTTQAEVVALDDEEGSCTRAAIHRGECVTLVPAWVPDMPLELVGKFRAGPIAYNIFDFPYNARFSDLLRIGGISTRLRDRVFFDIMLHLDILEAPFPEKKVMADDVMLDFGLRALPVTRPKDDGTLLDKDDLNFYRRHVERLSEDQHVDDLDREVDAINLAYLWSGHKSDDSETVLAVRSALRFMLLSQDQTFAAKLEETILAVPESPLKVLFVAITIMEGFLNAGLEVAEERLNSVLRELGPSRMRVLAEFLLAKLQVQRCQPFSRERMLTLANAGNLFAQVFISRHFAASVPVVRDEQELTLLLKLSKTGYGVAQALPCLSYCQLTKKTKVMERRIENLAKQSAACGNSIGKATWLSVTDETKEDLWQPSDCALAGVLSCLSKSSTTARVFFERANLDVALAFLNMESESDPTAAVSWLTCMDCCWPEDCDLRKTVWFQLISDRVLDAKLGYSLLTFQLDEDTVLRTVDFSKAETLEKVYSASRFMEYPEGDQFMERIQEKYLDVNGLRMLGGMYRSSGDIQGAIKCYTSAGLGRGSGEALMDLAVLCLEMNDKGKARAFAERAGFPYQLVVTGIIGEVDTDEVVTGFEMAAEAGDPCAMWCLGELLQSNNWLTRAANGGFSEAFVSFQTFSKYRKDVQSFWRYKEEEMSVKSLYYSFTHRIPASDAAMVAAFRKRWASSLPIVSW